MCERGEEPRGPQRAARIPERSEPGAARPPPLLGGRSKALRASLSSQNAVTTPAPSADVLLIRANKLDLLERLADDLAHEIKNPLHSMVINLEVLKRRLARAGEPDEVLRYIGVLGGELERVNRRIELLLRLSRPGRGPEAATLNELLEELMELVQLEARRRQVTVEYDPGNRISRVQVARAATRQVILNLVLEVLAALEDGGTLRLSLGELDGRAALTVAAPGVTFPDPETVVDGDPTSHYAVARALAEAVGGSVDPLPGEGLGGAVFSLPADRA
jgi:signal transduction histidine kinase